MDVHKYNKLRDITQLNIRTLLNEIDKKVNLQTQINMRRNNCRNMIRFIKVKVCFGYKEELQCN